MGSKRRNTGGPKRPRNNPPTPPPENPRDLPLNEDEVRFVNEFLIDRNATRAYRTTFPNCTHREARRDAYEFRHRPHVEAEISAALHSQNLRCQVDADRVLKELTRIATSDIVDLYNPDTGELYTNARHIPYNTRKAVAGIKASRVRTTTRTTRNGRSTTRTQIATTIIEYKLWNKLEALGKLARHLGLDTEITPLEALLRVLPTDLATSVRTALMHDTAPPPSANGVHK